MGQMFLKLNLNFECPHCFTISTYHFRWFIILTIMCAYRDQKISSEIFSLHIMIHPYNDLKSKFVRCLLNFLIWVGVQTQVPDNQEKTRKGGADIDWEMIIQVQLPKSFDLIVWSNERIFCVILRQLLLSLIYNDNENQGVLQIDRLIKRIFFQTNEYLLKELTIKKHKCITGQNLTGFI